MGVRLANEVSSFSHRTKKNYFWMKTDVSQQREFNDLLFLQGFFFPFFSHHIFGSPPLQQNNEYQSSSWASVKFFLPVHDPSFPSPGSVLLRRTGGSLTFFWGLGKIELSWSVSWPFILRSSVWILSRWVPPLKYFGDSFRSNRELGCLLLLSGCVQLGVARQLPDGPGKLLITP